MGIAYLDFAPVTNGSGHLQPSPAYGRVATSNFQASQAKQALLHLPFKRLSESIERTFSEPLAPLVRRNMYIELWASVAYGIFYAGAIQYIPVVLRRLGASSELLALYTAQTYLGSILTSLSIVLMRRRRPKHVIVLFWVVSRSLFLLFAFVTDAYWLLVIMAIFWLLESFPSPGYTRIIQVIYPERVRGQVISVVRLGMVVAILLATPVAGWALDWVGYRVLFHWLG